MPETHLKQSEFTYSACRPLTKNKERIRKFKETGDSRYIYQSKLDEVCFKRIWLTQVSREVLRDKAFKID